MCIVLRNLFNIRNNYSTFSIYDVREYTRIRKRKTNTSVSLMGNYLFTYIFVNIEQNWYKKILYFYNRHNKRMLRHNDKCFIYNFFLNAIQKYNETIKR